MEVVQAAELIQDLGILELLVAVGAFPLDMLFEAARGVDHQRMQILAVRHAHRVHGIRGDVDRVAGPQPMGFAADRPLHFTRDDIEGLAVRGMIMGGNGKARLPDRVEDRVAAFRLHLHG